MKKKFLVLFFTFVFCAGNVSADSTVKFGASGDIPFAADFNNDGKADVGVFTPVAGNWRIDYNFDGNTDLTINGWGKTAGDQPLTGDFDGDGKTDLAIFRVTDHKWYFDYNRDGKTDATLGPWGQTEGDQPLTGDFDGDGKTDLAIWRLAEKTFYLRGVMNICIPDSVEGCLVCDVNGNSWKEDSSKCATGQSCKKGECFGGLVNASSFLETPTYDGSGQAVHPDVLYFPSAWHGYKYWMVMTPYPDSNESYENPSILSSNDGLNWQAPSGISNPIAAAPPCDHNCDPDIIYNPDTDELWVYYLDVRRSERCNGTVNNNYLKLIKTADGINWTTPVTVINWNLDNSPLYLSPSVVRLNNGNYNLWAVNKATAKIERFKSLDGINWEKISSGVVPGNLWHIDANYIPAKKEFWIVSHSGNDLKFYRSADGFNWMTDGVNLLLSSGINDDWDANLYRGSFVYDQQTDSFRLWHSAYSSFGKWHIGYTKASYTKLANWLNNTCEPGIISGCGVCNHYGDAWVDDTSKCKTDQICEAGVCKAGQACVPKTCASLGNYQCGDWSDGCAATINCGACASGKKCNASGQCVSSGSGEGGGGGGGGGTTEPQKPMTREEILQKIAKVKLMLILLIQELIIELQKQLSAMPK